MKVSIIFVFITSFFSFADCCTFGGGDPYGTGSFMECCQGYKAELIPNVWQYRCLEDPSASKPTHKVAKGLALIGKLKNCEDLKALGVIWWYNWWINEDDCKNSGIEYIPMIWGANSWTNIIGLQESGWILAYNEPNINEEANLSPESVAKDWPKFEELGRKIVGPAVAMGGNMAGPEWYQKFMSACRDCQIDAIAIHIYEGNLGGFKYWVEQFKQFNKPIWITEWAFVGVDASQCEQLTNNVMEYFDSEPLIERVSFFGSRLSPHNFSSLANCSPMSPLNTNDMSLKPTGKAYRDYRFNQK